MEQQQAYELFERVAKRYFRSRCRDEWEDAFHDGYMQFFKAVNSDLDIQNLDAFAFTIAKRVYFEYLNNTILGRDRCGSFLGVAVPEAAPSDLTKQEIAELLPKLLRKLSRRYAEMLERFYLLEQDPDEIRAGMHLSQTQYRTTKTRALKQFGVYGRQLLRMPADRWRG